MQTTQADPANQLTPPLRLRSCLFWGLGMLVYLIPLAALYAESYSIMLRQWNGEDSNYCYVVPLVVAYLIWEKRAELRGLASRPSWWGLLPLTFGALLYLLGELGGEFYTLYLSSWFMLVGLLWLHLGWRKLRVIAFPVCFLAAMFPFPYMVRSSLTLGLKLVSSDLGVKLLRFSGAAVFQEGNIIDLGFTQLEVVEACSGLRYLFPLILFAILLVSFSRARLWQRALVVISAVPLSIIINSLRLFGMARLYPLLGPRILSGFWHDFFGWLLFVGSIGVLLAELRLLLRLAPMAAPTLSAAGGGATLAQMEYPGVRKVWPRALAALFMLVSLAVVIRAVDFREEVPSARPMTEFPMRIGGWQGSRTSMEQIYLDALKLSDYLLADYRDDQRRMVSLYVAYNESQRKGQSSHSPASCLPGSGWVFKNSGVISLPVGADGALAEVKRAVMEKSGSRMLVYYWFSQRGRVLTNIFQLKWYAFWDALTRQRTDGALVRLLTTVHDGEKPEDAEARLQSFVYQVGPQLNNFLPGK